MVVSPPKRPLAGAFVEFAGLTLDSFVLGGLKIPPENGLGVGVEEGEATATDGSFTLTSGQVVSEAFSI